MSLSLKDRVAGSATHPAELTPTQRKRWYTKLPRAMQQSIVMGTAWWFEGRPEQQTPPGKWRWWLICAGRGFGKALDVSTPVPTPTGWTTMGDLRDGDMVLGADGRPTRVLKAWPVMHDRPCYRVVFSDGAEVIADADHQWTARSRADRRAGRAYRTVTTADLAARLTVAGERNWQMPVNQALQLPAADLPVDPWLLGYWLGDGTRAAAEVTVSDDDAPHILSGCAAAGAPVTGPARREPGARCATYPIGGRPHARDAATGRMTGNGSLHSALRAAGVLRGKHVPAAYLRASEPQRRALLAGLIDADGHVSQAAGAVELTFTDRRLAETATELVRTLGHRATLSDEPAALDGRTVGRRHRITWVARSGGGTLPRKVLPDRGHLAQPDRIRSRYVAAVEPAQSRPVRCITVAADDALYLAGEAMLVTHNTRTGAEWSAEKARRYPGARIALVAPTFGDGRDTMVEGESGLLSVLHPTELRGGSEASAWNRSMGELFLTNGSRFKIYSSERPKRLRGPQHHFAWGDEPAYWEDVEQGAAKDSTFSNLNIGLRLPPMPGWERTYRPQGIFTTTPRRVPLLKMPDELVKEQPARAGLLQRPDVIVTTGSTMDNIDNLDETYKEAVVDPLIGTTLGVQELGGVMLEDVEGALWSTDLLTVDRLEAAPRLSRVVVAFDPAGGAGYGHDEHGIMVVGAAGARREQQFYLLADRSANCTPNDAAKRAIMAYLEFGAAAIVYEKNQGQDWIPAVFRAVWDTMTTRNAAGKVQLEAYEGQPMPHMDAVDAVKNKRERATPVAMLAQQHRTHMVGVYPILENQLTTWAPDEGLKSPDRLDAYVWGVTWLYEHGPGAEVASAAGRERRGRGRRAGMPNSRLPAVYSSGRSGRLAAA